MNYADNSRVLSLAVCMVVIGSHHIADIDECLEGGCSSVEGATCVNTEGSFECQCNTGYRLTDDGQQCEGMSFFHPYIHI